MKKRHRKTLIVSEDTFFLAVQLVCGPPKKGAFDYYRSGLHPLEQGLRAWLKFDPEGQQFTHIVLTYGEAKTRVPRWYIKYKLWWERQRGESLPPHSFSSGRKVRKVSSPWSN